MKLESIVMSEPRSAIRRRAWEFCVASVALSTIAMVAGCPSAVTPVTGPAPGTAAGVSGNSRPTVSITLPSNNLLVTEGELVNVVWTVNDTAGENVIINLRVVNVVTQQTAVNLIAGEIVTTTGTTISRSESFSTAGLAGGTFVIRLSASDNVNPVQEATSPGTVQVVTAGTEPTNASPTITLLNPAFDQAVAQGDRVAFSWIDADPDSAALVVLALDLDTVPTNDNPFNTDDPGIIVLGQTIEDLDPIVNEMDGTIANPLADTFIFEVDVSQIPVRENGEPYNPCAIITDGGNPAVRSYSAGRIFVTQLAESPILLSLGTPRAVDLGTVGTTVTGATFLGFNPGAYLGNRMRSIGDFDADGASDFVMLARFGRPFGYPANRARGVPQGSSGEAYLGYGNPPITLPDGTVIPGAKYGGISNANSISRSLPGVIIASPFPFEGDNEGLTDVAPVPDLPHLAVSGGQVIGDGRPEILFGLPHHNGITNRRDDDPGDSADQVEFILDSSTSTTTSGDSYTGGGDNTGGTNCFKTLLVIDLDADDSTMEFGPFISYFTFTPTQSDLNRIRSLANTPGAEVQSNLVLFVNEPGDDMIVNGINVDDLVDPCAIPPGGFMIGDLVELGDVGGGEVGEQETDVADFVAANILGGRESFSFQLLPDPESPEEGEMFDTVRLQSAEGFNSPRLEITITQQDISFGCYPDAFSNNLSDSPPTNDPQFSDIFGNAVPFWLERLGSVIMCSSENRDCAGIINPDRWTNDQVILDLIGQEPIDYECPTAADGSNRFYGARWNSTIYDSVDHLSLSQPPIEDSFGFHVDSMPDLNNDQIGEIIISSPTLELDQQELISTYGFLPSGLPRSTHAASRRYTANVLVQFGSDFNAGTFRDSSTNDGCSTFPNLPNHGVNPVPRCGANPVSRVLRAPGGFIEIFSENIDDRLGGARYAGDFNQDFSPDIIMGAPASSPPGTIGGGTCYVLYGRPNAGDVLLAEANIPGQRPPMLRVFGDNSGDQVGLIQGLMQDFNGDGLDDVYCASKMIDFQGTDNGAVGLIFGGTEIDGDRQFSQIGTTQLPGLIFFGENDGDLAGADVAGAAFFDTERNIGGFFSGLATGGDFNGDGRGDIVICAPGATRVLPSGQRRQGVVYIIFGQPDLYDPTPGAVNAFSLSLVGTSALPGIILVGPYEPGTLDADGTVNGIGDLDGAPNHCGYVGDINGDGFSDVMIGNTRADFVDPAAPASRRPDAGEVYLIYGNNFGANNPAGF